MKGEVRAHTEAKKTIEVLLVHEKEMEDSSGMKDGSGTYMYLRGDLWLGSNMRGLEATKTKDMSGQLWFWLRRSTQRETTLARGPEVQEVRGGGTIALPGNSSMR